MKQFSTILLVRVFPLRPAYLTAAAILIVKCLSSPVVFGDGKIQYNRDIKPILSENCFACHGPDANKRSADLRLDQRADAIEANAFVPSSADQSEMITRIFSKDPDSVMPTPSSHKTLTSQQKELLKAWINEGAEYQSHWAFLPVGRPDLPQVRNVAWVRNPIDRFVLSGLERLGLDPAPEADIRALVRRVCYDLTGLPPTTDEVEQVVADPSPLRYENYVDELLKRPEWGEHRGRYWLDYARYADTHGIHFDNFREMWSYREWVVRAFNQNMPFDQFTIEQLAGDLLENPSLDQKIATGFNRCNITTNEGGIIDEEYKVLYARDRVETTSAVWMGLTVGCAVCHDHKFDPVSQQDFYQLAAFFNNTTQAVRDGNIKDTPPIVTVPTFDDRQRYQELDDALGTVKQKKEDYKKGLRSEFDSRIADAKEKSKIAWEVLPANASLELHVPLADTDTKTISVIHSGQWTSLALEKEVKPQGGYLSESAWQVSDVFPSLPGGDVEQSDAFTVSLWIKPKDGNQNGALVAKMDDANKSRGWDVWTEGGTVGMHLVNAWPENAIKVTTKAKLAAGKWQHVAITYDGSSKAKGVTIFINGVESESNVGRDSLSETIKSTVPFRLGSRSGGGHASKNATIQDVRLYRKALSREERDAISQLPRAQYLVRKADRTEQETDELFGWKLKSSDEVYRKFESDIQQLTGQVAEIKTRGTIAHIMNEAKEEASAYILTRGDYDKRGQQVKPATPKVLPGMKSDLPMNRLGFAKWLLQEDHPLTTRVTVNRFWQEIFGNGLVGSSGDFGATGQMPSHPELLDYLSTEFRGNSWNVKDFFRFLVTSAAYRQSTSVSPEKLAIDPTNKWLSRGPRFRMDAEMIRDSALAVSGLLVSKIGGPSVRPYQPPGVWEAVAMPESNTRIYKQDSGEGLYRRSMYTFLKRAAPPPNMDAFNATAREVCTIKRERTNTPLQALVTLNDIQFVEAARVLAERMLLEKPVGSDKSTRLQKLAKTILSRPLRAEELSIAIISLEDLAKFYSHEPEQAKKLIATGDSKPNANVDPSELAAWTMLTNQMMNLDEFLTK
jgi:hypothetical protein